MFFPNIYYSGFFVKKTIQPVFFYTIQSAADARIADTSLDEINDEIAHVQAANEMLRSH